jgi:hypothetical protein
MVMFFREFALPQFPECQQFYCRDSCIAMQPNLRAFMDTPSNDQINPGDEAAAGTPGTGEDICEVCQGSGKAASGGQCPNCGGTGKVIEGIGGG